MSTSVILTADQLKTLETSLLDIPGKFGIPLLQLINGFIQENAPKPPVEKEAEKV